jgi:uroporphyrinogen-III synthase
MKRIIATKKLQSNHKQWLLNANVMVVDADFIQIQYTPKILTSINEYIVFTSKNAIEALLDQPDFDTLKNHPCCCVGSKTADRLIQLGFNLVAVADYATALVEILAQNFKSKSFTFFSGNIRSEVLPQFFKQYDIHWNEYVVYQTTLTPHTINSQADAILFFSPSAVESYLIKNQIGTAICFCIGTTTAKALEDHTQNIVVAKKTTTENVVLHCVNYYKNNQ